MLSGAGKFGPMPFDQVNLADLVNFGLPRWIQMIWNCLNPEIMFTNVVPSLKTTQNMLISDNVYLSLSKKLSKEMRLIQLY